MKRAEMFFLLLIMVLLSVPASSNERIRVQVSVLPHKYIAERIGGDRIDVDVLVQPGKSPATYAPTPDQIRKLLSSCVYFRVGVPFENGLMDKIHSLSPNTRIVDTREGIVLRTMTAHHHDEDDHGDEHHHEKEHRDHQAENHEEGRDPHIWMSPVLVKTQAQTMYKTLCDCDPEGKTRYTENLERFLKDMDDLDRKLRAILEPVSGGNVFVFHPSFGYFTDQYGLNQVAIETMGKAPKGKEFARLIQTFKHDNARIIFVQPQFDRHTAQRIAGAINGKVVAIDPLAYDYMENMISMAQAVASALKKP